MVQSIFLSHTVPPSLEDIEATAKSIVANLPEGLKKYTGELEIVVENSPDTFITQEMEMDVETSEMSEMDMVEPSEMDMDASEPPEMDMEQFGMLGCYESSGPSVIGHLTTNGDNQDRLYLYRLSILKLWAKTEEIFPDVINSVILQEIGNHFNISHDDIEMYGEDHSDGVKMCGGNMLGATVPRI